MNDLNLIGILGFLVILFLSINAYFLKGILQELSELKVTAAKLLSDSVHIEKELDRIDEEIKGIREKIHDLSNNVAKIRQ